MKSLFCVVLLSSAMLVSCRDAKEASTVKEIVNVLNAKTYQGQSAQGACGLTVMWNEQGVAEVKLKGEGLSSYRATGMDALELSFSLNLAMLESDLGRTALGQEYKQKGYQTWHKLEQRAHVFGSGLTLAGTVGWFMGESLAFPAPSTINMVEQELALTGKIDAAGGKIELSAASLKQKARAGTLLAAGASSWTCSKLVEGKNP